MKVVQIQAWAKDMFHISLHNSDTPWELEFEHEGYYLDGGDDIVLTIDYDTGQIIDWENHKALLDSNIEEQNSK